MIEVKKITSDYLKNTRDLFILLPPGYYKEPEKEYPVFYMNDGQNLFSTHGDWFKKWNLDIVVKNMLLKGFMEEIVIVGIANTPKRCFEYTPTYDMLEKDGGGGNIYLKFLTEEVKPLIEKTWRVKKEKTDLAIGGSSLGGIQTLYSAIKKSDIFSKFAVISPSLWWDFGVMFDMTRNWEADPPGLKIWLDIGRKEGTVTRKKRLDEILKEIYRPVEFNRVLRDILIKKGFVKGKNLRYIEDIKGVHDEISWGRRMYLVLKFFFPKKNSGKKQNKF